MTTIRVLLVLLFVLAPCITIDAAELRPRQRRAAQKAPAQKAPAAQKAAQKGRRARARCGLFGRRCG